MTDNTVNDLTLGRRAFLTSTGAPLVTLFSAPADWATAATYGAATRPPVTGDQLDSYITIGADGTVTAYYGKIDGGQGLETAIAQMVAEEIELPYERVRVIMGDSALTLDMGGASAAIGVSHGGMTRAEPPPRLAEC
jgi:CO/xanthine dehydrogenase Mo-binding subunit